MATVQRKISVFNHVSLDGYFVDGKGDMSWAHQAAQDEEWNAYVNGNAQGDSTMLFGRVTYDLMAGYWPTPMAMQSMPAVAERMNSAQKVVFSRTMDKAAWKNTRLIRDNMIEEVKKMKQEPGTPMVIMGSGRIIAQLAEAGLIDSYSVIVNAIVIGSGRTMFDGVKNRLALKLVNSRAFNNGNVLLTYEPKG